MTFQSIINRMGFKGALVLGTVAVLAIAARATVGHELRAVQSDGTIVQRAGLDDDWKRLGDTIVKRRGEKDEIKVGADEGKFSKIKLEVHGADVEIIRLKVVYGNGADDEIEVKDTIKEGQSTRPLDLKNNDRIIKRVVFWYKTEAGEDRKARVTLYGKG